MSSAADFFSNAEVQQLVEAITRAELTTRGEIRVHVENWCWLDPQRRAKRVFRRLKMHQTRERTGVLLYIAVRSHKMAIIGDAAIHAAVPDGFWQQCLQQLQLAFREKRYTEGVIEAVKSCGQELSTHFPSTDDNPDELPNEISFG